MGLLDGKVAIVFGASANNGGTSAHFMAREGAKIIAIDIVPDSTQETVDFLHSRGYDAIGITGDGTQSDFVRSAVEQGVEHYGQIDICLNMVGRQFRWPVWEINEHDWKREIDGYLTGGMLVTKYVSRHMIDKGVQGSIIHICTDAALQGEEGNSGYSAAKAGLLNFARAAAMDLSHYGIRVNTICPTYIEHNLWRFGGPGGGLNRYGLTPNDFLQGIPLGRFCRSSDVANTVIYLGSDLSSFVTAVDIPLDGGAGRKYWPWQPGKARGINAVDYYNNTPRTRFGEPIES